MQNLLIGARIGLEDACVGRVDDHLEVFEEGQLLAEVCTVEEIKLVGEDGEANACGFASGNGGTKFGADDGARVSPARGTHEITHLVPVLAYEFGDFSGAAFPIVALGYFVSLHCAPEGVGLGREGPLPCERAIG